MRSAILPTSPCSRLCPGDLLVPVVSVGVYAQNLGTQPATGQAVQGQTAALPEGTVLNLVNWVGNVISPVGAALAVVMAVILIPKDAVLRDGR